MSTDPLAELPRLGAEAMGPCAVCDRQLLETGLPIFYRVKVQQCGLDAAEIRRHVGLANVMGGGTDGLVLAEVLGPRVEPVVVMADGPTINICARCQNRPEYLLLAELALRGGDDGKV